VSDYYATLRIQQGRLKAAMQERGIKTAAELSRISGVSQGSIGRLLNFKISSRCKHGEWRDITLAICKTLGSEPGDIFPEQLEHEIPTNRISSFVESAQLSGASFRQLGPSEECERAEASQIIDEVLDTLTVRECMMLKSRVYNKMTLEDIATEAGLSRERIRQIEAKAFRKMRHPARLAKLDGLCEVYDEK